MNIFKDPTTEMPTWWEKPVRTALDQTETVAKARLPGSMHFSGRDVVHVERPRRGHDM